MNSWGRVGVFDLETTGVDVDSSRIVSACVAILGDQGEVVARWDWLADPKIAIPEGAAAVHGITTEMAQANGRSAAAVTAEIAQTLRALFALGMPVVAYNAPYDFSLLDRECRRHHVEPLDNPAPIIDPLVIDKALDRFRKGKRTLTAAAERYGVVLDDAHDAGADAIAAGRVALALAAAFPEELGIPLPQLHASQEFWYAEQASSFQDYIRKVKGDETFVADHDWPVRPIDDPSLFIDTMPIPRPRPRPSLTVPVIDIYAPGTLSLESLARVPVTAFAASSPLTAAAPPPTPPKRPTVLRVTAGIITDASGRTLLVRKRGTTAFMQAGGKIETGESALDALSRELKEEIGLELDLDNTEYIGSFRAVAANEPNTVVRAEVFALSISTKVSAAGEIEELLWIDGTDVPHVELAPLTRDTILPLWAERRSAMF